MKMRINIPSIEHINHKIFWIDDEPESILTTIEDLKKVGFNISIFNKIDEALNCIRDSTKDGSREVFHVGIADLWLPGDKYDGLRFTNYVISLYQIYKRPPARIGYVSEHKDRVNQKSLKEIPFVFKYEKTDIRTRMLDDLIVDITINAYHFKADLAALKYNEENPPKYKYPGGLARGIDLIDTLFAYVHKIEGDSMWLRIWNPKKLMSESTRMFSKKFLEDRGVYFEGQALRLCIFKDSHTKALIQYYQPIESSRAPKWLSLRPDFKFNRFRKRR